MVFHFHSDSSTFNEDLDVLDDIDAGSISSISDIYVINSNELKGDYDDPTTINTFCDEDMYEMKDVWPVSTPRLDQDQMVSFPQ